MALDDIGLAIPATLFDDAVFPSLKLAAAYGRNRALVIEKDRKGPWDNFAGTSEDLEKKPIETIVLDSTGRKGIRAIVSAVSKKGGIRQYPIWLYVPGMEYSWPRSVTLYSGVVPYTLTTCNPSIDDSAIIPASWAPTSVTTPKTGDCIHIKDGEIKALPKNIEWAKAQGWGPAIEALKSRWENQLRSGSILKRRRNVDDTISELHKQDLEEERKRSLQVALEETAEDYAKKAKNLLNDLDPREAANNFLVGAVAAGGILVGLGVLAAVLSKKKGGRR